MDFHISTYGAQVVGDSLWFSNNTFNSLFKLQIESRKLEAVEIFPDEQIGRWGMHKKIFSYGDKLVFLPAYGNHIHMYDTKSKIFDCYRFDEDESERKIDRISDACIVKDEIYIFPVDREGNLKKFNPETGKLEIVPEFIEQVEKSELIEKEYLITRTEVDDSGNICFAFWDTDVFARWNVSSGELSIEHTGIKNLFSAHIIGGQKWFITTNSDSVYCMDDDGTVREYKGLKKNKTDGRAYNRVSQFGSNVLVLPAFDDTVYAVKDGKLIEIAQLMPVNSKNNSPFSFETCVINNELWILPFETKECLIIGNDLSIKDRVPFEFDNDDLKIEILLDKYQVYSGEGLVQENDDFGLGEYIMTIKK